MNIYDENVFATPNVTNLKHKPLAVSSSKKKKTLDDVKNTIHSRNLETNLKELSKVGGVGENAGLKKTLKSPKPSTVKPVSSTSVLNDFDWNVPDDVFVGCRCQKHLDVDLPDLPEELRLSKNDIDRFATVWNNNTEKLANKTSYGYDELDSMSVKIRDIWGSLYNSFSENDSFLNLLDENYGVTVPVVAVCE